MAAKSGSVKIKPGIAKVPNSGATRKTPMDKGSKFENAKALPKGNQKPTRPGAK